MEQAILRYRDDGFYAKVRVSCFRFGPSPSKKLLWRQEFSALMVTLATRAYDWKMLPTMS